MLTATVEDTAHQPYAGEMILVTIEGRYRRHITLEKLEQPAHDGFGWMQGFGDLELSVTMAEAAPGWHLALRVLHRRDRRDPALRRVSCG